MGNDMFTYVFAALALIFLVGGIVNKIRTLSRRNRREVREIINRTGGTQEAPVKLDDPFASDAKAKGASIYTWR